MERLTTDNPKSNTEIMLNYAYAKDGKVLLQYGNGEEDVDLCEYISQIAETKCCAPTPQEVMDGSCMECDCELAVLNAVAIQAAELRARLKEYEDTSLTPAEVAELAKAKSEGRLLVTPCKVGDTVYCTNTGKTKEDAAASFKYDGNWSFMLENTGNVHWMIERFGKTVFLTREDAEKALKENEQK